ncbi:MAG: polyphosphate kinase 2 [Pseudomonadota bacterium]
MSSPYKQALRALQIQLVRMQRRIIDEGLRVLVLFEGRDTSGKDGVIKRVTQHLSPRDLRVVALGKPSDRDTASWYFQRYAHHLPADGELVLFNRSWYNRAGVERVMGFCSDEQHERFLRQVLPFERMLVDSGTILLKYFLDISRDEQAERLAARREDPLKQWKISPIDAVALEHWDEYSAARDEMLTRTHTREIPWWVVRTNEKREARLNVIRHLLSEVCPDLTPQADAPEGKLDEDVLFAFGPDRLPGKSAAQRNTTTLAH